MEFLHAMMQVAGLDPFLPQNIFRTGLKFHSQGLMLEGGMDLQHFVVKY